MPEGSIFEGVNYYLAEGNLKDLNEVKRLLREGGGALREFYPGELVTHVVADSRPDASSSLLQQLSDAATIVSGDWVRLSVKCGAALPTAPFELSNGKLFSQLVFCTSKLARSDQESLCVLVTYYGGRLQRRLDSAVTHLVTMETTGLKYECAMQRGIKTVSPDWLLDSIEQGRCLEEERYHPSNLVRNITSPTFLYNQETGTSPTTSQSASNEEAVTNPTASYSTLNEAIPTTSCGVSMKEPLAKPISSSSTAVGGDLHGTIVHGDVTAPDGGELPGNKEEDPVVEPSLHSVPMLEKTASEEGSDGLTPVEMAQPEIATAQTDSDKPPLLAEKETDSVAPILPDQNTSTEVHISQHPLGVDHTPLAHATTGHQSPGVEHTSVAHTATAAASSVQELPPASLQPERLQLLEGMVLFFLDYQECMESDTIAKWKQVVLQHGGAVLEEYDPAHCTHVLALHKKSQLFEQAYSEGKCVSSAHWLNDVLTEQRMFPPRSALHLPTAFRWQQLPTADSFSVTLTNYTDAERELVKDLIRIAGLPYTGHLSRETTHLVCKRAEGKKYEKAVEWGVRVVNASFLAHMIHTGAPPSPSSSPSSVEAHSLIGSPDEFNPVCCKEVAGILKPWEQFMAEFSRRHPDWTADDVDPAHWGKRQRDDHWQLSNEPHKKPRLEAEGRAVGVRTSSPIVLFTGIIQSTAKKLKQVVSSLGGRITDRPCDCTHLVAPRVTRTVKFLSGLSVCGHVTTPEWVESSGRAGSFQEETAFPLRDRDAERLFLMEVATSLERARQRKLLQDLLLFATEGVQPPYSSLKEIVECAGGKLLSESELRERYGSPLEEGLAAAQRQSGSQQQRLIVISCPQDVAGGKCSAFYSSNIAVHNAEFILTGVLRQELDHAQNQLLEALP